MSAEVEIKLRAPESYELARETLAQMESHKVWPTSTNYELWTHLVADPSGPLAQEITRILASGQAFTDSLSDELAAAFLPKARLNDQIRDAGDALSKELSSVSQAIQSAQKSSAAYGVTLADASKSFAEPAEAVNVQATVERLAAATQRVQLQNQALEQRLAESTEEVARLREHLEQVRKDATTDGLTNLANRKAFDEELDRACAEADAQGEALTLAILDIDHFKNFNDTWGHQTGDQVLRYVAGVIGSRGAAPRFAARYGGEEFAMIFPREQADIVASVLGDVRQEVSSRVLKRRSTNEDLGTITLSAGFAERIAGEPPSNTLERADGALYNAKRSGRNRVTDANAVDQAA
jgi:diguanylate cyclase